MFSTLNQHHKPISGSVPVRRLSITSEEFCTFLDTEHEKWSRVVRDARVQLDRRCSATRMRVWLRCPHECPLSAGFFQPADVPLPARSGHCANNDGRALWVET